MFGKKENQSDWAEVEPKAKQSSYSKKMEGIISIYQKPVLPALCRIIVWMMFIVIVAMLLVDITAFIRYATFLGTVHLFYNICTTGFWGWLLFAVFLVPLCLLGIRESKKGYTDKKRKAGISDKTKEEAERSQRALRRLNNAYYLYIRVTVIGILWWSGLYLIYYFICCYE